MKRLRPCLAVLALLAATAGAAPVQPEAASGYIAKPAVTATHHMAVTANPHGTEAAMGVLREGGSAVDAAIAAALVLNVVEPQSSGIGGGGFLLAWDARRGRVHAYDGRERAPRAADARLFERADGSPMDFYEAVVGTRSVGVPGLPDMLRLAHARHGRLPWARLFAPAIALAEEGFAVSPRLHELIARDRFLSRDAQARALFFDAAGAPLAVGTRLRNPALAAVLRQLAEEGVEPFYRGALAADIVGRVRGDTNAGALDHEDLASYRARERPVLCGAYRGYRVCGMPPPSSGGGTVLAMLGMLSRFEMGEVRPGSAFAAHLFAEAGRRAFADRDAWYGDPRAMTVSVDALLAPGYLARRAAGIRLDAAGEDTVSAGVPGEAGGSPERPSTTHLSIVDAEGNAVALTASIEDAFGSRSMVRGFLLNNQLTDFAFAAAPEHPNLPGPGRQPRSSMSPTLVFAPDGQLFAVLGSPGGSHIINYVAQALVGIIDWRMAPDAALALPHVSNRNRVTEIEARPEGERLAASMGLAFGHRTTLRDLTSGLHVIVRSGDGWAGAADPRREGTVGAGGEGVAPLRPEPPGSGCSAR